MLFYPKVLAVIGSTVNCAQGWSQEAAQLREVTFYIH